MAGIPTRVVERSYFETGHRVLAGMDEVGRGALAGPVSVGVVAIDAQTGRMPAGVRDSKLLTPAARNALVGHVRCWARASGVGHASPEEIDTYGIVGALCLAGHRALTHLGLTVDLVLLDGVHDWMTTTPPLDLPCPTPAVSTHKKGDLRISSIAAASILAKTERDALMQAAHEEHPRYGWDSNKGYAAPGHLQALRHHGATPFHRRSWRLPLPEHGVQDSLLPQ